MSDDLGTGPRDAIASLVLAARLDGHPICLDSGPLIDYLARQRPVTDLLDPLLLDPAVPVVISTITLVEVLGRPALAGDTAVIGAIRRALLALPAFRIVDLDQAHAVETALVRAGTGLKLTDAAIIATARLANASALLGNDRQWGTKPLGVAYHHVDDLLALPS